MKHTASHREQVKQTEAGLKEQMNRAGCMKLENVSALLVLQIASGEFLALSQDQFEEARALGRRIMSAAPVAANDGPEEKLLTAEEMEARTSIPASWFLGASTAERDSACALRQIRAVQLLRGLRSLRARPSFRRGGKQ